MGWSIRRCFSPPTGGVLPAVRERAESLRRKAASLEHAYQLAAPGVNPDRFLPPRRSKVFQEVAPYTKLYELMMRWCTMGDLDMRGSLLALRTARMDRFYEYYVLLAILSKLDQHGFRPSNAVEPPIEVVEYSLAKTSRYFRNEGQVANKIVLDGKTGTVALYYQPDHDAETAEVFSEYDDCHGAGASPIESEAAVDSDLNASSDQAPAARQNGIPKDCEAIASKPTDDSVAALDERSDDCEGAASEDEVPPGAETFTHAHIEAVEAQAKATEEQASNVPKPRAGSKGKRAARGDSPTRAGNLVRQIAELLGQNESLLFDDGWSRDNLGLGRPALRASRPTGKEAGRYVPYTLNGGDLFLAKDWTPLNINKANQLIRRLSK